MSARLTPFDDPFVLLRQHAHARQRGWLDQRLPYGLMTVVTLLFIDGLDSAHSSFYQPFGNLSARLFVLYALVMIRLTLEGAIAGSTIRQGVRDLLITTPRSTGAIVFSLWRSTLWHLRGWVLLLVYGYAFAALLQIAAGLLYRDSDTSLLTVLVAAVWLLPQLFLMAIGAIGLGAAMGMAIRRLGAFGGWAGALIVQSIPPVAVVLVMLASNPNVPPTADMLFRGYTDRDSFIAFGDAGMIALNRLSVYGVTIYMSDPFRVSTRALYPGVVLAILPTWHVHLLFAFGSAAWLAFQLRPAIWRAPTRTRRGPIDQLVPAALLIGGVGLLVWLWLTVPRVPLTFDIPPFPYVNREWVRAAQIVMAGVMTVCGVRAIAAGVGIEGGPNGETLITAARTTVSHLRGWIAALALLLMLTFALLFIDHLLNGYGLRALAVSEGYWYRWGELQRSAFSQPNRVLLQWQPLQIVIGLIWPIVMAYSLIIGGVLLGIGARLLLRRPWVALIAALAVRVLPVAIGLLPPNFVTQPHPGLLAVRFEQDGLFAIADGGLTVLVGLAEPGWTPYDYLPGLMPVSLGLALGAIALYGGLAVALVPFVIVWGRRALAARRASGSTPSAAETA